MRQIIGGRNLIKTRYSDRRVAIWWFVFATGIILGAIVVIIQMALEESNAARDHAASLQYSNEIGGISSAGGAPADGLGQAPLLNEIRNTEGIEKLNNMIIRVYMTKEHKIERVPLETYVRGVVAGEMPIAFESEALKAQAIAARTYIVRRIVLKDGSGMPTAGVGSKADVTDTIDHQVYIPLTELAGKWPKVDQQKNMSKLDEAVEQTRGQIITFEGKPIQAVFFSTSNGYTENSEEYWQQKIPYLRSVESPWDKGISPRYKETVTLTLEQFFNKLGIKESGNGMPSIRIVERTTGNRIGRITIDGKALSGREVREKLALASSQFIWNIKGGSITITTFGYGHGVGMSQWGANGMAQAGKKAEEILVHYYSGTKVEQASKLSIQLKK